VGRDTLSEMDCPIARTVAVIGDAWTPLILRDIYAGNARFDGIQASLGISRKVLAQRLATLIDHGILDRTPYQDNPVRYHYGLTEKGLELGGVLLAMKGWGDRWTASGSGTPPMEVRHTRCGHLAEPALTCSHCGEPLDPAEISIETLNGAAWPVPLVG